MENNNTSSNSLYWNSFLFIASIAGLLILLSNLSFHFCYSEDSIVKIRGIWTIAAIARPLILFWEGALLCHLTRSSKRWPGYLAGFISHACIVFYGTQPDYEMMYEAFLYIAMLLSGFVLVGRAPQEKTIGRFGEILSLALCLALIYAFVHFGHDRLEAATFIEKDMPMRRGTQISTGYGMLLAMLACSYYTTLLSFSVKVQMAMERKWIRTTAVILCIVLALIATYYFISLLAIFGMRIALHALPWLLADPLFLYIIVVLVRSRRLKGKAAPKEILSIGEIKK